MSPVNPITNGKPTEGYIRFQSGFEYQLVDPAMYRIPDDLWKQILEKAGIKEAIDTSFVSLSLDGILLHKPGFAWNGVSGPTIQRNSNRRGGQVHDGVCRLIRYGLLPISIRFIADEILRRIWIEDGMWEWLANSEIKVMQWATDAYVKPSAEPVVMTSP